MRRFDLRRSGPWIGVTGLVCILWLYGASALVAPPWAVTALLGVWLVQFALAVRWFQRRPYVVLAMPLVAAVVWFAALLGGAWLFGWNA